MRRRRVGRPGLVGTMARTAVITGTATAVHGNVAGRKAAAQQSAAEQQAAEQAAWDSQARVAQMEAEMAAMKAQQAPPAPAPAPAPAAPAGGDMLGQLQQLADLKAAGVLDDAEFAAAKAKLLGT